MDNTTTHEGTMPPTFTGEIPVAAKPPGGHYDALVIEDRVRIPAWVTDLVNGDHETGGSSSPAAVAGYPSITVPAGFAFGLPLAISFIGKAWSEPTLIKLAYAFEQATKVRKAPRFLPTAELKAS